MSNRRRWWVWMWLVSAWLVLVLFAGNGRAQIDVMLFPDGTDSIGIPRFPYRGTCFVRCEQATGYSISCTVAQRIADPFPIDCANHCRNLPTQTYLPLPQNGAAWRHANTGFCLFVREVQSRRIHYPACHSENYQFIRLQQFGPGDSECFYPTLADGVPFEYLDPFQVIPSDTYVDTALPLEPDTDTEFAAGPSSPAAYTIRKIPRRMLRKRLRMYRQGER